MSETEGDGRPVALLPEPSSSDALALLRDDHRHIEAMLQDCAALGDGRPSEADRSGLLMRLGAMLLNHARLEEELFYPALQLSAMAREDARTDHMEIELQFRQLAIGGLSDAEFRARTATLTQLVSGHVLAEEEQLFPRAGALSLELGPRMARRRAELLGDPPWINKFYILDLRPENSFVRWLVAQGYSVFLVSWVNPDGRAAAKGFEDYMREGIFAALEQVEKTTGVKDPNCVGYCIGGTLLAASLAFMAAKGDKRIHSATFWAAQTDFSDAGELSVFVDEVQLDALKARMDSEGGVLAGAKMANAFNMLRANDLIWSFFINNYLLGKKAAPFDLLYWNSDTTRMPQKLHLSYLRECYLNNALARGEMELAGVKLDLAKITIPTYFQSAREDHIAPAASVLRGARLFGGTRRFILAGSGHIAGVINPPAAGKYQYWTRGDDGLPDALPNTLEEWQDGAHEHPGSWWPDWDRWLSARSGAKVAARIPGNGGKILGDAPGSYVKVKAR